MRHMFKWALPSLVVEDNPATADVECNDWSRITQITNPRFLRFTVQFDF